MSGHWRLAFRCAAWIAAVALAVWVVISYVYGQAHALAFGYGAGVGVISFVSTAITVSLLTGRSKVAGVLLGALSFVVRYGFAAVALGVPAYMGLWPVAAMLAGFAGVYFAETALLVPWSLRRMSFPSAGREVEEGVERRAEA